MKIILDVLDSKKIAENDFVGMADGIDISSNFNDGLSIDGKVRLISGVMDLIPKDQLVFIGIKIENGLGDAVNEAKKLSKNFKNIVISVLPSLDGIKLCKMVAELGIQVNITRCSSASQAIIAAKNNATFVSFSIGKLDDLSINGIDHIIETRSIYDNYPDFKTSIITRSIRHPMHVIESAKVGVDAVCMSTDIMHRMAQCSFGNLS